MISAVCSDVVCILYNLSRKCDGLNLSRNIRDLPNFHKLYIYIYIYIYYVFSLASRRYFRWFVIQYPGRVGDEIGKRIKYIVRPIYPGWLVGWGFYGISTFVGYLAPNPFLCKYSALFETIQFSMTTRFN